MLSHPYIVYVVNCWQSENCGDLDRCARCVRLALPCSWDLTREIWEIGNNARTEDLRNEIRQYDSRNRTAFLDDLGPRLLLWAARNGQLRTVELLVEIGVDLEVIDDDGFTSLHLSALKSHHLVVRALLNSNASTDPHDKFRDETPLHYAAECGNGKIIESLLSAGASPNTRSRFLGKTPLHRAVNADNRRAIELLLAGGSVPDAEDASGKTPLFYAKSGAAVRGLVRWGARLNARNKAMETPLHYVMWSGSRGREVISAMLEAGADPN